MFRQSSMCNYMAYCGLLALLIACVSGLPDKYWCCPSGSAAGGRCIKCYGLICPLRLGGPTNPCPTERLYYYESLCGQYTKCNASAKPRRYWQCPGDGKKCRPCMGEHGELPVEFGGCPRQGIHSSESECAAATTCTESGTGVSATPCVNAWCFTTPQIHIPTDKCVQKDLSKCINRFLHGINLEHLPKDAPELEAYLQELITNKGKVGFTQVCGAFSMLELCLGRNYSSCLSVPSMENLGLDSINAAGYVMLAHGMSYECGTGFNVMYQNLDCIIAAMNHHNTISFFNACRQTFMDKVKKDPNNTCKYANTFVKCIPKLFESCGDQVVQTICTTSVTGLAVILPKCKNLTCS